MVNDDRSMSIPYNTISGWWLSLPLWKILKNMSSSIEMMNLPTESKNKRHVTNHQPVGHHMTGRSFYDPKTSWRNVWWSKFGHGQTCWRSFYTHEFGTTGHTRMMIGGKSIETHAQKKADLIWFPILWTGKEWSFHFSQKTCLCVSKRRHRTTRTICIVIYFQWVSNPKYVSKMPKQFKQCSSSL